MNAIIKRIVLQQEMVNSISHGAGLLFGLVCIPNLIFLANKNGSPAVVPAICMYGFGFLMVFTCSTLYHSFNQPRTKQLFKILDHISIYFLISGTYTPFIIIYVNNTFGISLLIVLWLLTFFGIFFKIFYTGKFDRFSTIIYMLMGLLLLVGGKSFFTTMPVIIIRLIIIGGVLYIAGVPFYIWKKYRYHHGIWHLFVLAGAICHYIAILKAVIFH